MSRASDPRGFGRVAVLMGGTSAEREVSLMSGEAVTAALRARGVDATPVDVGRDLPRVLASNNFDRAWIALHGRGGEDGTVQGLLDFLGLPYTGSGVLGSAISMDKLRSKQLFAGAGLPTAPWQALRGPADLEAAVAQLGLPLMIKPAAEGSSIGMSKVEQAGAMAAAWERAAACGCEVFAERWLSGAEYTVAILKGRALPLVRIEAQGGFYDYQAKYFSDETRYHCPAGLAADREHELAALALAAFEAAGASGWGRIDLMLDAAGAPLILEANTVPGMTSHSLVPMAAAQAGIDFAELCWQVLETSLASSAGAREDGNAAHG
jgi:D-alanine-D-alanine ligase